MGDSPVHFFLFLLLFFFKILTIFRLAIYVIILAVICFLLSAYFTFEPPEGSGRRLCRGAPCQEYFWYLSIYYVCCNFSPLRGLIIFFVSFIL
jgi:hypothetical protein